MALADKIVLEVPQELSGRRLDQVVAALCPTFSRSQLQKWIKAGLVTVNGDIANTRDKVLIGAGIIIQPEVIEQLDDQPEKITLDIVYEDEHILVINKPAGLVVHPGAGNRVGTLLNALLYYDEKQKNLPRAGIVHRLDKDTSGLMVVARTLEAHQSLVEQLENRTVKREYLTLVYSEVVAGASIEANIGRHPIDRKKMAVVERGKYALTHYRIERRFRGFTFLRVNLETGRTHQIRVHLTWRLMPLVGDYVYQGRPRIPKGMTVESREAIQKFPRQALHATKLGLYHPSTGDEMSWEVPLPFDIEQLLAQLD